MAAPTMPSISTERRAPAERAKRERRERERAALAVVVGAQQNQDVFEGDDDDQRPHDQRQHAEHDLARDGAASPPPRWRLRGTRRAGWCRCRRRRRRCCRASASKSSVPPWPSPWGPGSAVGGDVAGATFGMIRIGAVWRSAAYSTGLCGAIRVDGGWRIANGAIVDSGMTRAVTSAHSRMSRPDVIPPSLFALAIRRPQRRRSRLEPGRQRRLLAHQRDGDASVGRHIGVVGEQRLSVGLAGHHEHAARRHAVLLEDAAARCWRGRRTAPTDRRPSAAARASPRCGP